MLSSYQVNNSPVNNHLHGLRLNNSPVNSQISQINSSQSSPVSQLDNYHLSVIDSLFDIARNIEISADFSIQHPQYQPFAIPSTVAQRFRHNSPDLQRKYLNLLLRNFLHGIYYNGALQPILSTNNHQCSHLLTNGLEPNYKLGIDRNFYQQLHENNHGIGNYDADWEVLRIEPDGTMAVMKNNLTLYVEPECYLKSDRYPTPGDLIGIWMPKNRLQNGCYIAIGNCNQQHPFHTHNHHINYYSKIIAKIYFNITPSGAIALMNILTKRLNDASIPFSFEVLYNPISYRRYDTATLQFNCQDYPAIHKILEPTYLETEIYFQPQIPLFTKYLAPGLSLAEEPNQKFSPEESFGMNRCQIIANALLEAWQKGKNAIEERIQIIQQHFASQLIDLHYPYLNPSSQDIYIP